LAQISRQHGGGCGGKHRGKRKRQGEKRHRGTAGAIQLVRHSTWLFGLPSVRQLILMAQLRSGSRALLLAMHAALNFLERPMVLVLGCVPRVRWRDRWTGGEGWGSSRDLAQCSWKNRQVKPRKAT
jgi:hypothetical protein